jgi:hypothetical protein
LTKTIAKIADTHRSNKLGFISASLKEQRGKCTSMRVRRQTIRKSSDIMEARANKNTGSGMNITPMRSELS